MAFRWTRRKRAGDVGAPATVGPSPTRWQTDAALAAAPMPGERACCCRGLPRVRVLVPKPGGPGGPDGLVDLLLCAHHYRVSAARLRESGALAVGNDGSLPGAPGPANPVGSQRQGA